jgi:hypothetical protein
MPRQLQGGQAGRQRASPLRESEQLRAHGASRSNGCARAPACAALPPEGAAGGERLPGLVARAARASASGQWSCVSGLWASRPYIWASRNSSSWCRPTAAPGPGAPPSGAAALSVLSRSWQCSGDSCRHAATASGVRTPAGRGMGRRELGRRSVQPPPRWVQRAAVRARQPPREHARCADPRGPQRLTFAILIHGCIDSERPVQRQQRGGGLAELGGEQGDRQDAKIDHILAWCHGHDLHGVPAATALHARTGACCVLVVDNQRGRILQRPQSEAELAPGRSMLGVCQAAG